MALLVEQEIIFHPGEFAGLRCKLLDSRDSYPGTLACQKQLLIIIKIKVGQRAQWRDLVDMRKVIEPIRRSRQQCPRSKKSQLIEGGPALPGKGMYPPRGLVIGLIIDLIIGAGAISSIGGSDTGDYFPGGRCQLIKVQPGCHKRSWRGIVRGLHIPLKVSESFMNVYSRSSYFFSIIENPRKNC